MKKNNKILIHYILHIVFILVIIYLIINIYQIYQPSTNGSMKQLISILKPGNYTGSSKITKTDLYPNGIKTIHNVSIRFINNELIAINNIKGFDQKTNKLVYDGVRNIKFYKLPSHGNNIFRNSESYINNKLVSSLHGYLTNITNNSVTFNSSGSWHMSTNDFKNIKINIKKINEDFFTTEIIHKNKFNIIDFTMSEKYEKVSD